MALVTEDEVRVLLRENSTDMPNDQVTPHITLANLVVTEDITPADSSLTTARKTQIELYLAAHFAVLAWERGGLGEQSISTSREEYKRITSRALGLSSTRFGQQALALDPTGVLQSMEARANMPKKEAHFRVV